MKLKTRLCRLEFTETDIFHVTAQYVELNGQPCVLELISKIDNGRWLDSGDKRLLLENAQAPSDDSAQTDTLTGVRSRYYLEQTLGGQVEVDGVALIDADLFKSVNDTYGHQAGDAALRTIASVISSCVRSSDILIRYGGDEFLLLFPRIPKPPSSFGWNRFARRSVPSPCRITRSCASPSLSAGPTASSRWTRPSGRRTGRCIAEKHSGRSHEPRRKGAS